LLAVGAASTGIGVRWVDDDRSRSGLLSTWTVGFSLPIEYPVGKQLPDLGDAPGPLAAVWVVPRVGGSGPELVGLVAETQEFGTLPIEVSREYARGEYLPLSPDGRRIAYKSPKDQVVVGDLVSGESYAPAFENFEPTEGFTWVDATHLVGHADMNADGAVSEAEGWVWEPGTAPKEINVIDYVGSPYLWADAGWKPWISTDPDHPRKCLSDPHDGGGPILCDVVGRLGPEFALTHDGDGAVIALDIRGVEDETLWHVVAAPGAPPHGTFATDLIAQALGLAGGAS
jgi:hypothetical protein